ncbi:MAG: hypothetical protein RQ826_16400, partial [Xanthomonadales bacterium]|nr:hypothetical protein [Xanthomonadales bacterium]
MKAFYDRILKNEVGKYVKKFGSKVGTTRIRTGNAPDSVVEQYADQADHPFTKAQSKEVWSIDVTPKMRDTAMAGQPMFSRSQPGGKGGGATPESFRSALGRSTHRALTDSGMIEFVDGLDGVPGNHPSNAAAVYINGKAFINTRMVVEGGETGIVLHEIGVHKGMRDFLGQETYDKLSAQLQRQIERGQRADAPKAARQAWEAHKRAQVSARASADFYKATTGREMSQEQYDRILMEETWAYMAELGANSSLWHRFVSAIKTALIRMGLAPRFVNGLNNADIASLARGSVARIVDRVESGQPSYAPAMRESVYSVQRAVDLAAEKFADVRFRSESAFFQEFWPTLLRRTGLRRPATARNIGRGVRQAVQDIEAWLRDNPRFMEYYEADMAATQEVLKEHFTDLTAEQFEFFRAMLGVTSPSTMLPSNVKESVLALDMYLRDSNFDAIEMGVSEKGNVIVTSSPISFSNATAPNKARSLKVLERLAREQGGLQQALEYLKEMIPVKDLHTFKKEMGYKSRVSKIGQIRALTMAATGQDKLVPRAFIFGSKVGAYTLNTMGDGRFTTIDIWESRFIRSYFADMFGEKQTGLPKDAAEHALFEEFNRRFKAEMEAKYGQEFAASALQAMRWFYILNAAQSAGYTGAKTNKTISEYSQAAIKRLREGNRRDGRQSDPGSEARYSIQDEASPIDSTHRAAVSPTIAPDESQRNLSVNVDALDEDIRYSINGDWEAPIKIKKSSPSYETTREALELAGLKKSREDRWYNRLQEKAWESLGPELRSSILQGTLDRFHGLKIAEASALGNLPAEQSAYVAARLSTGIASTMRAMLYHGAPEWRDGIISKVKGSKGILDILKPVKGDLNAFMGWMVARRAGRLLKEGRENLFTPEHIDALTKNGEAAKSFDKFEAVAAELDAYKSRVLDVAEQAGLIDPEARAAWDSSDYIPFYRMTENETVAAGGNRQSLSGQTSGIRTLRGGTSRLNDPLENLLMNFTHLMDASMKNHAIRLAERNLKGSGVFEEVTTEFETAIVPLSQVRKRLKEAGVDVSMIPREALQGMAKMWAIKPPGKGSNVVRIMDGGKAKYYRVTDPLLLRALTAIRDPALNSIALRIGRSAKRIFTRGVTADPAFMARNFIRDMLHAWTINEDHYKLGIDSIAGAAKSLRERGGYVEMAFSGASFMGGYVNANDPAEVSREIRRSLRGRGYNAASANQFVASIIDSPLKLWELYTGFGDAIENASREAVYEAARKKGKSRAQSVFESKDLMDYSMRGDFVAIQILTDLVPFLNARAQ